MFQKLNSLIRQNRKIALTLLLLTSAVLVACDRNTTTSSGGTNSSGNNSSLTSSSEEFNGSEVPNWNLENPVISTASTGLDLGLDQQYFGRYEGDYILYTGSKNFEGSTNPGIGYRAYVIVNQKTGTEFFRWELDPGTDYITWALANNVSHGWGMDRYTFEGNTLYGTLWVTPQGAWNNANSLVKEDYAPFVDYVNSNFSTKYPDQNSRLQRQYRFIFKADMTTKEITLLGASDSWEYEINDLFADQGTLFVTLQVTKGSQTPNPFASLLPLPTEVPTLTPNASRYSLIYQLDITDLSLNATSVLSSTSDTYPFLNNFRRGFDVKNYDNDGNLYINLNMNFTAANRTEIATKINNFNTSTLNSTQLAALKTEQIPIIENYFDLIAEEMTFSNFSFTIGLSGGFDLETNQFVYFFSNSNNYLNDNVANISYEGSRWQQYFEYEDESYLIENDRLMVHDNTLPYYNWFAMPSTYNVSRLYRINLETQVKTLLLDYENEGVYLTGIYRYTGGFYVTGVYNDSDEFTTGLGKAEAFLRAYNTTFTKTGEVVLSGSEDDTTQGIILDDTNKPVWLVTSNSNDGDFATVASDNTEKTNRQYYVRFN